MVAFILSLLLSLLGLLFIEQLLPPLGANDELLPLCVEYAVPILIIMPFTIFGMIFYMSFITVGKAHIGLIVSMLGGAVNILLDYLFIAKLGMGIGGAAIATGIGYSIPALAGLCYFSFNRRGSLFLVRPRLDLSVLWKSSSNGRVGDGVEPLRERRRTALQ